MAGVTARCEPLPPHTHRSGIHIVPDERFEPMNNPAKVMTALSHAGYEFLISDVELAFTFTRIASRAVGDRDKRIRNLQNARRAYQKVQELVPRVGLTAEQQQHVTQKLVALKSALEKVGQPV